MYLLCTLTPQTLMVQNASQFVSHHICNSIYFQETGVTKLTWDKRGLEHLIHQRCQLHFCFTLSQSEILLVVIVQFSRSYFIWTPPFQHKLAKVLHVSVWNEFHCIMHFALLSYTCTSSRRRPSTLSSHEGTIFSSS